MDDDASSTDISPASTSAVTEDIGPFGCAARVAWILDQIFRAMDIPDLDSQLARVNALDETLRLFLADMMRQIHERQLLCCEPLSAAFRFVVAFMPESLY